MSDELTPEELDEQSAEALPDREAMSVLAPPEATFDGGEILLPVEKEDVGHPIDPL